MATPSPISRLALIPEARPAEPDTAVVRRYRLARLTLNRPRPRGADRNEHLRRVYD